MNSTSGVSLVDSHADRKATLMAATWSWTCASIIFVATRFYCRVGIIRKVWWDDYIMLLALGCTIALSIVLTIYGNKGGCRHAASLTASELVEVSHINWVVQPLCVASLTTGKLSVGALILRLQSPKKWRKILIWILCGIMVAMNSGIIILMFTQCSPTRELWNPASTPNGHCINRTSFSIITQAGSAYMAFIDIAFAVLPVHMIWNLQMDRKKKRATCVLLSTGWMAFGFAVVKIKQLGSLANLTDITWATVWLFVWNAFEINIIICAACIPTLVPLYEILSSKFSPAHSKQTKPAYNLYSSSRLRERFSRRNKYMRSGDTEVFDETLILQDTLKSATGNVYLITAEGGFSHPTTVFDGKANQNQSVDRHNISVTKQWSVQETK